MSCSLSVEVSLARFLFGPIANALMKRVEIVGENALVRSVVERLMILEPPDTPARSSIVKAHGATDQAIQGGPT